MLDHDEIERQGLQAITKVLLGFGGTVVYWGFYEVERGTCGWGLFLQIGLFLISNKFEFWASCTDTRSCGLTISEEAIKYHHCAPFISQTSPQK